MSDEPRILVDADACPVKAETVKVAERHGLEVVFVANAWISLPRGPRVRMQVVPGAFDAADDWIAEATAPDDIVITADIPLASRCLKAGARVLGPAARRRSVRKTARGSWMHSRTPYATRGAHARRDPPRSRLRTSPFERALTTSR